MNPILKTIIAVISGILPGSVVNGGIIMISSSVIPPPDGADVTTMEGLMASMHLFEPKHFIMPFLAHSFGTFSGAFLASKIASSHEMKFALLIGIVFLANGIINVVPLPSPLWFSVFNFVYNYYP